MGAHFPPPTEYTHPLQASIIEITITFYLIKTMTLTRYSLALGLCLFFLSSLYAQTEIIPLWPEGIPCESENVEQVRTRENGIRSFISVQKPELHVYLPEADKRSGNAIMICPGGGYYALAWDWEGTSFAKWFNERGVTAIVLKSRLPHWENENCRDKVALLDAQRGMRIIRSKAKEWGVDSQRIGVMGFSAGGHLASTLSTHFDLGDPAAKNPVETVSCRPDFSVLVYPVISMDTAVAHGGSRRNLIGSNPGQHLIEYYSNDKQVTAQTPPTFLVHADDDAGVIPENSILYYLALRKAGVPAEMHIYEKGGHGFSFGKDKAGKPRGPVVDWTNRLEAWLISRGWM